MSRSLLLWTLLAISALSGEPRGTVVIPLVGELPLRSAPALLADAAWDLHTARERLREAFAERPAALVIDLSRGFRAGPAAAEALASVLRQRPAGSRVICLLGDVGDSALIIAAAADEIVLDQAAPLAVRGLAAESWYLAPALGKLGIRCHAVVSGPFKTAPEMFTREGPSEEARAEMQQLLHAIDTAMSDLTRRPGFDAAALARLRAMGLQTAQDAIAAGLPAQAVEVPSWFATLPQPLRRWKPQRALPDLSTLGGWWQLLSEVLGKDRGQRAPRAFAVVELAGLIAPEERSWPGETIADGDTLRLIEQLRDDPRIVAVVVRIASSGGESAASARIHHALRRLDAVKPVVVLLDAVAASGGYWIALGGREIIAHRTTITGSIGAFALLPDLDGACELLGVRRHVESAAPLADILHWGRWDAAREQAWRRLVSDIDARFRATVAQCRRLPPERVATLAEGRVFSGEQALASGLVDALGSLDLAIARAATHAGVPPTLPLERYPRVGGLVARLGLADALVDVRRVQRWRAMLTSGPRLLAFRPLPDIR
ncbi:MAG: S49 family peptidase [Planctomycetota bacterium]|nr:S49 family peptidase [Planctomycetota bacterium]